MNTKLNNNHNNIIYAIQFLLNNGYLDGILYCFDILLHLIKSGSPTNITTYPNKLVKLINTDKSLNIPPINILGIIHEILSTGCNHFLLFTLSLNNSSKFPDIISPLTGIQNIIYIGGRIRIKYLIINAITVLFPPEKSLPFQFEKLSVTKSNESLPKYNAAGNAINIVNPIKIILFIIKPNYNFYYPLMSTGYNIIGIPWWYINENVKLEAISPKFLKSKSKYTILGFI